MNIFISGTDTNVGKTLISAWIAVHTGFSYFKPIQSGTDEGIDSEIVHALSHVTIYPEIYRYPLAVSPHWAAKCCGDRIDLKKIALPTDQALIVEGAGGVFVPLNEQDLMLDLMQHLKIPVILVARTALGTINHTLLSLHALRSRCIPILGVILNDGKNEGGNSTQHGNNTENMTREYTAHAIEHYGSVPVLAEFSELDTINHTMLKHISFSEKLAGILKGLYN